MSPNIIYTALSLMIFSLSSFAGVCKRNPIVVAEMVRVSEKPCEEISETDLRAIKELFISFNQFEITDVQPLALADFKGLPALEVLELFIADRDDHLIDVPDDLLSEQIQLKKLNIIGCDNIKSSFYQNLSNLEMLGLTPKAWDCGKPQEFLKYIPQLKSLSFGRETAILPTENRAFANAPHLEKLVLFGWLPIEYIEGDLFAGMNSLRELEIYDYPRDFYTIPKNFFDHVQHIEKLTFISSKMNFIQPGLLSNLPDLRELKLRVGAIKSLPSDLLKSSKKLEILQIEGRQALKDLPNDLLINQNKMKEVSIYDLLDRSSETNSIPASFLKNVSGLEKINFSNNKINFVPFELFDSAATGATIDLSGNKISYENKKELRNKYPDLQFYFD